MAKISRSSKKRKIDKAKHYLEKTRYYGTSNATFYAIARLDNYKRRALDLGCGALRDSKFLFNCGFIVEAIDKNPLVKDYTQFFKHRPKELFNLTIADYNKHYFGKNKYLLINAQNTLSFNGKAEVEKLVDKIYKALKKGGSFSGNLYGPNDSWAKIKSNKTSFYTLEDVKKLLSKFKIENIWEKEEDGKTTDCKKKHWHHITFVVQKPL